MGKEGEASSVSALPGRASAAGAGRCVADAACCFSGMTSCVLKTYSSESHYMLPEGLARLGDSVEACAGRVQYSRVWDRHAQGHTLRHELVQGHVVTVELRYR